ncbi:hypothetical protein L6164_008720 [Bauhinia variegata]|uniref:Uncharacterized protein n=1 Tax=Bauhinia variegata TaxID=167791 RepID=A0ACB9PHL7_BAUVA|nr:hypothetical protein L6164_008720 [Bauhinia variegata]
MYCNFKENAAEYIKQAVHEDDAGNYRKALTLYMSALEYLKVHLKYEKNPKIKETVTEKFIDYLRMAEEIRAILDTGGSGTNLNNEAADAVRVEMRETRRIQRKQSSRLALQEAVILPVKFPQFLTGKRKPCRAFLLYGPPGTGKSYLAKAVATEADSTFFSVSSSDLVSKWMGESEKLTHQNRTSCTNAGVGKEDQKVLILAATNTPYALDKAIRRRFDKRISIPLPDQKARQHMFKVHLGDTPRNLTKKDFEELAYKTDGFSGSDISVCVNEVLFEPVRKTWDAKFFREYLMECGSLVSLMKKELLTLASRNLMHKDLLQRFFHQPSQEQILIRS